MTCRHPSKAVSAVTGEVYCVTCGQVLGRASVVRPCGCPADPVVFGHLCREQGPARQKYVTSRGVTLRYPQ